MGIVRFSFLILLLPHLGAAEELDLSCSGSNPDWTLSYDGASAEFDFAGRKSMMEVPQKSTAEGADWPKAATLIAPRDSAIILIHQRQCGMMDHEMQVLTQRGETPLLLTGCCTSQD